MDDSKRAEEALRAALTEVAQLRDRLQAENIYLLEEVKQQQGFEEIIGRSPVLQRALRQVEQVAPTDTTVLITGRDRDRQGAGRPRDPQPERPAKTAPW